MTFASGSQLAQSRPSGTSAVTLYTATMRTEITALVICNTTGSSANYSVYHHNTGTTFDATTALAETVALPANTFTTIFVSNTPGCGLTVSNGGAIGIKSGTGNAITFSLYGVTETRRSNV